METNEHRTKTLEIVNVFKNSNPWQGNVEERGKKFQKCFEDLKKVYNKPKLKLIISVDSKISNWHTSAASYFDIRRKVIVLNGRLSVITFLHEFAHALNGHSEEKAREWSVDIFKEVFPDKFEKLNHNYNMYIKEKK